MCNIALRGTNNYSNTAHLLAYFIQLNTCTLKGTLGLFTGMISFFFSY